MRALHTAVVVSAMMASGCILDSVIPGHQSSDNGNAPTVAQTPFQDLALTYAPDPTTDGGAPVKFADVQVQLDSLGCTTSQCHGGSTVPVLTASPTTNAALLANYYDLISGCADGVPDPSDCLSAHAPDSSLLLSKTCATSGVDHAGGKPFVDNTAPVYKQWEAWIAAGAPF